MTNDEWLDEIIKRGVEREIARGEAIVRVVAVMKRTFATAALLALLGLAGYALYTTGWNAGYDAALEDAFESGHVEEIRA